MKEDNRKQFYDLLRNDYNLHEFEELCSCSWKALNINNEMSTYDNVICEVYNNEKETWKHVIFGCNSLSVKWEILRTINTKDVYKVDHSSGAVFYTDIDESCGYFSVTNGFITIDSIENANFDIIDNTQRIPRSFHRAAQSFKNLISTRKKTTDKK